MSDWTMICVEEYRVFNETAGTSIQCESFDAADLRLMVERKAHPNDIICLIAVVDA